MVQLTMVGVVSTSVTWYYVDNACQECVNERVRLSPQVLPPPGLYKDASVDTQLFSLLCHAVLLARTFDSTQTRVANMVRLVVRASDAEGLKVLDDCRDASKEYVFSR